MSETVEPKGPSAQAAEVPEISEEQRQRMTYKKGLRRKRRKEREAAGEIKELNITAMMDMMTIILVFLLKSFNSSPIASAAAGEVTPPISTSRLAPKETITITITRCIPAPGKACQLGQGTVVVNEKVILNYEGDKFPADQKDGGADGLLVLPLLDAFKKEVEKIRYIAQYNKAVVFTGELSLVGDKNMPYRMLTEVLYTAGQAELDSYRFVVIQDERGEAGGGGGGG